jgi:hypothetical protein
MKTLLILAAFSLIGSQVLADILCEGFDDPLGGWRSRWLAQNSNMQNYYVCTGGSNENDRGNNPCGLWICDGNVDDQNCLIDFDPAFGATMGTLMIGIMPFVDEEYYVYDLHGVEIFHQHLPADGTFPPCPTGSIDCDAPHGIGRIALMNTGQGQVEGNTSVDNVCETVCCPSPVRPLSWGAIKSLYR